MITFVQENTYTVNMHKQTWAKNCKVCKVLAIKYAGNTKFIICDKFPTNSITLNY